MGIRGGSVLAPGRPFQWIDAEVVLLLLLTFTQRVSGAHALTASGARARLGGGRLVLQLAGAGGLCPRNWIPGPLAKWDPLLSGTKLKRVVNVS